MPYVREDVANLLQLLSANPAPQMHEVDHATARDMYRQMGSITERPAPALARKEDISIPGPAGPVPAHDSLCAEIAHQLGVSVIAVDYRLAPETRFPGATEDCLAATRWAATSPAILGHKATGLILAGDSAGGNLAAAVARETARELPLIAQWLIYPGVDMGWEGGSLAEFSEGYLLTAAGMTWFMTHYAPDNDHPWASPLRATEWDGLPPALVFTCGLDPLRDQGRAYAARLIETGHRVVYREAAGQIHGCMTMRGGIPSAQADLEGQIADLKALIA